MTMRSIRWSAVLSLLLAVASVSATAQVAQTLTSALSGRPYEPAYVFFTAQGSEAILNFSRVNGRCASNTACTTDASCVAFPGAICNNGFCQVPVDAIVGQVAVVDQVRFCEIAACAGGVVPAGCAGAVCPGGQTYCGTVGSCHTCPAALNLCLCDGGSTCDATDAALGTTGVPMDDGFDDPSNPNLWLLDVATIDASLDSRLVLGPGAALSEELTFATAGTRFRVTSGGSYVLVVKYGVNPRQSWAECYPQKHISLFLSTRAPQWCDLDDDGVSGTDCNAANGTVWAIPGEVGNVAFSKGGGTTTLTWAPPPALGGTAAATTYRVYGGSRADLPSLANASADSCLVAATSGASTDISGSPSAGALAWYLVRAGNACAEGSAGSATAGPRIQDVRGCSDGDACTSDACDPSSGCVHTPVSCDDGSVCTADSCDPGSGCIHTDMSFQCNDGNVCTTDSCNPVTGCAHTNNTASCDDGNTCTTGDACSGGICVGQLPTGHLVISQIQTNGDGTVPADDEFVELYNPTGSAVSLSGLSLQYKSAGGSTYLVDVLPPALSIPSHGWFLIARSSYNGGVTLDQANSAFLMSATGGNLFVVNGTVALSTTCSTSASIIDKVGYGTGNCSEGGFVTAPGANGSIMRKPGGACGNGQDTNDNVTDFLTQAVSTPRNRFSPPQP
jgi:hypothetical protein